MEEKSFEELYNESLQENNFEKTITGKIIEITSKGEIFVNFGYKADGIIPLKEFSEDGTKDPKEEFKIGDTITADVLKMNDGEGNVLLSYKRAKRRRDAIQAKERKVQEAKQKELQKIEKIKKKEEFWNNIKVGSKYVGIISKIVDYGLFIDLGVTKGLLHVSEILWNKEEKLENKFNIGDEIEVKIKSFDKEENKISLSYPLKGENPWFNLANKYHVNDVVTCRIMKFVPFGAFLEIEKGLEGLVHNSQITGLKRVIKPEEELKLGQFVNAKITNIDKEKCKIGLSIKELEGTSMEYGYEEYIKGEVKNEQ